MDAENVERIRISFLVCRAWATSPTVSLPAMAALYVGDDVSRRMAGFVAACVIDAADVLRTRLSVANLEECGMELATAIDSIVGDALPRLTHDEFVALRAHLGQELARMTDSTRNRD